ncbi:hypothetical protein E8E12_008484 [Didymella heteroderae]|uniref:Heme haloperoxidase family profile domain-containing protein n=1 Tax=Didymella heteroderae TaxID=1769908 RepID=A0A9P4WNK3_9PLEO|nr:hypothetical protein E8E12_008484 [Didymella heteroderae]
MKQNILLLAATASLASGSPQYGTPTNPHEWMPGGAGDFRGPCPMLNTLTNHGFLPRDGRNLTRANVIKGLGDGLNFDATLAGIMWDQAIIVNPAPNATFFTLEQLNVHNVLEHDASLSRADAALGNNHLFNQTVFDSTKAWWTAETVTVEQLAHSKIFRQLNERLPIELGWSKKSNSITLETILNMTAIVRNATNLLTGGAFAPVNPHRRRDLHNGLF